MITKKLRLIVLFILVYSIIISCSQYCPTRCTGGQCTSQPCQLRGVIVNVGHK